MKKRFYRACIATKAACLLAVILTSTIAQAQQIDPNALGYFTDALRFSRHTSLFGSARTQAMGGVENAIGDGYTAGNGNPAGLGLSRKSKFGISPAFGVANTNTTFLGEGLQDSKLNGNLNGFSLVLTLIKDDILPDKWRGGSFAISFNRINSFQNRFSYEGINNQNTMGDYLAESAFGVDRNSLLVPTDSIFNLPELAFNTFLIDEYLDAPGEYYTLARDGNNNLLGRVLQQEVINTRGAQYQWSFAYGGNYDDKFYFGLAMGIRTLNFKQSKEFKETVIYENNTIPSLLDYTITDELEVKGTGINFSLGLIYRPVDFIRIGASVTTPTFYALTENFKTGITANFDNFAYDGVVLNTESFETVPGTFNYQLTTPLRLSAGIAFFLGKRGFISGDVELNSYNQTRLQGASSFTFNGDNKTIKNIYKTTLNIKVGGEYRVNSMFRLRAGAALFGDPYNNIDNVDRKVLHLTGGVGFRLPGATIDIALVNSRFNSVYVPYTLSDNTHPTTSTTNSMTSAIVTVGFSF
ncbi:OmpP1/FadL family transporter [uncultured Microscilla sp.]|uniref:OmpP1/FadL family transporter n=1 Tax=uncultured Microscilla sp. TaxID=432653 RepID=UPI00261DEABE|nr:outer membrane protein transport protein [uncultured Microscilla sp.]